MKKIFISVATLLCGAVVFLTMQVLNLQKEIKKTEIKEEKVENEKLSVPISGMHNSHAFVDLGLPSKTLWATCNIGANSPEEFGNFYAWGETITKKEYSMLNYFDYDHTSKNNSYEDIGYTKYTSKTKKVLDETDDVAAKLWGENWKMPTKAQFDELVKECYWERTTSYNEKSVIGFMVFKAKKNADKGKISGVRTEKYSEKDIHIFLPAAGFSMFEKREGNDEAGCYWSRSLDVEEEKNFTAHTLSFGFYVGVKPNGRIFGCSVRAVCKI